jgi:hypothetical protein
VAVIRHDVIILSRPLLGLNRTTRDAEWLADSRLNQPLTRQYG